MDCMKVRADLLHYLYPPDTSDSLVWLAVGGDIEADDENFSPLVARQINHVANCVACQKWLDTINPGRVTARETAAKYCCAHMQGAVNDNDRTKFSFEMFRNEEPCWRINDDYAFAQFCPWCGQALPCGPFE